MRLVACGVFGLCWFRQLLSHNLMRLNDHALQAKLAARRQWPVLPAHGEKVQVAQLLAGPAAEHRTAALLAARPTLRHLPYSLAAKGSTARKVGRGSSGLRRCCRCPAAELLCWLCCDRNRWLIRVWGCTVQLSSSEVGSVHAPCRWRFSAAQGCHTAGMLAAL